MDEPYTPPNANLDDKEDVVRKIPWVVRFLSICMIIGAVVSIITLAFLFRKLASQPALAIILFPFLALFIIYIWKGIRLWQDKPGAYKWAFWLFLIQIPIISFPGFNYYLYTGLIVAFQFGDVATNLIFKLGGQFSFYISPAIKAQYFGVNLFALSACISLFRMMSRKSE